MWHSAVRGWIVRQTSDFRTVVRLVTKFYILYTELKLLLCVCVCVFGYVSGTDEPIGAKRDMFIP
jgi:hypothetical protein